MAEVRIAIYKTPAQAEKIGTYFSDSRTISKSAAVELREYCYDVEKGRLTTMGLISLSSPIIGVLLGASIGTTIGTATGVSALMQSYFQQLGDNAKFLIDKMATNQVVKFTYRYKRHGSNDGAYWLVDVS